jgi:hypothetical protein
MAITSLDAIITNIQPPIDYMKVASTAEAAGVLLSLQLTAGNPGAGTAQASRTLAAPGTFTAYTQLAGSIPFPGTVAGKNIHLAAWEMSHSANIGGFGLYDRLWQVDTVASGIVVTTLTAQTITPPTLPARDADGTTNGNQVMAALEVQTTTGNGSAITNMTISYTNSAGTAGRTGTIAAANPFPATAQAGSFIPFALQAGDQGIRSIQSLTLGTSLVSGTVSLVVYRQIAAIGTPLANTSYTKDAIALGMPRMYDGSTPFICAMPTGTALGIVDGTITYTQG